MTEPTVVYANEYERLKSIEREYKHAMRVVAVLVEQVLGKANGSRMVISDDALVNCPDLLAWRDPDKEATYFEVRR